MGSNSIRSEYLHFCCTIASSYGCIRLSSMSSSRIHLRTVSHPILHFIHASHHLSQTDQRVSTTQHRRSNLSGQTELDRAEFLPLDFPLRSSDEYLSRARDHWSIVFWWRLDENIQRTGPLRYSTASRRVSPSVSFEWCDDETEFSHPALLQPSVIDSSESILRHPPACVEHLQRPECLHRSSLQILFTSIWNIVGARCLYTIRWYIDETSTADRWDQIPHQRLPWHHSTIAVDGKSSTMTDARESLLIFSSSSDNLAKRLEFYKNSKH